MPLNCRPDSASQAGPRRPAETCPRRLSVSARPGLVHRGVNEKYRHCCARLLPQGRGLPVGMPGAHARPRIHPIDRRGSLQRRLHDQLEVQRVSGDSRAHLRPPLRASLPARTGRERAGGDLSPQTRRRRLQGRHPRPPAEARQGQERQAHRAGRRRTGFAHRGSRPGPTWLPLRGVRPGPESGRHDPHADSRASGCRRPSSTRNATISSISASSLLAASASTASRRC